MCHARPRASQFFWLLFDSDLTPAGKNLLDVRYACFGYTVDGARLLSDVKEGDTIVSAKVSACTAHFRASPCTTHVQPITPLSLPLVQVTSDIENLIPAKSES